MSAQHAEGRVFSTSPWKALLLTAGSLIFVTIGVFAGYEERLLLVASTVFFGLCAAIGVLAIIRPFRLSLGPEGFELSGGARLKRKAVRWSEVSEFVLIQRRGTVLIGYNFKDRTRRSAVTKLNRMAGADAGLPGMFDCPPEELVAELRDWHSSFG